MKHGGAGQATGVEELQRPRTNPMDDPEVFFEEEEEGEGEILLGLLEEKAEEDKSAMRTERGGVVVWHLLHVL